MEGFFEEHNDFSILADSSRPPQHNARNIASSYGQTYGRDDSDADSDAHHERSETLLRDIVREHPMLPDYISDDNRSSYSGDEGLEGHQLDGHIDVADMGYYHKAEMRRLIAHHHHCECPICPHRIHASVDEWRMGVAVNPDTPDTMYPEQGSGEASMMSSMFLETRPQTPGQLLAEMGSWPTPAESIDRVYSDGYDYVTEPLWLVPERMVPRQLETCIPEESEPASDDGY